MNWKARNKCNTVLDVVTSLSGMTEEELLNPTACESSQIENLSAAAELISAAIADKMPVSIMGDYDADGITSSSILYHMLQAMGITPHVRLPHRFSEGYGLSVNAVTEFEPGLLITVDNGIAAVEAIRAAKDKGMRVVILDHHLPGDALPDADVIVDPHIHPEENGFVDYCGAGLAYKLAQHMMPGKTAFLAQMVALAAIGTVADSMPLCGDNRIIVKKGLEQMSDINRNSLTPGLRALLKAAEVYSIDEQDIGFKVGPMLNAAGRLLDDGAHIAFQTLTAFDDKEGNSFAEQLIELNTKRKTLTAEAEILVENIIRDDCMYYDSPLCVYAENIPEGIVGIITGRLAEKYKTPAFLFTNSETEGVLKGSGRSYKDINLMDIVKAAEPYLLRFGGHAGAAGLSVNEELFTDMVNAMHAAMEGYEIPDNEDIEYDLAINANEVAKYYQEVKKYAPYGEGNPRPVFYVKDIVLSPRLGQPAKYMGDKMQHVKMHGRGYSIICFGRADDYRNMGCPINLDVVGELSMNVFRYSSELQIEASDFHECRKAHANTSSLLDALHRNGTI